MTRRRGPTPRRGVRWGGERTSSPRAAMAKSNRTAGTEEQSFGRRVPRTRWATTMSVPLLKARVSLKGARGGDLAVPPTDEKEALRKGLVLNNHQKNLTAGNAPIMKSLTE